jgi:hypothetical protein
MRDTIDMANEAGGILLSDSEIWGLGYEFELYQLKAFEALVRADERERICKAIKEEDDYCVTEGDYMLDSDDCIAVAKGEWVRPDYSVDAIRARSNT